MRLNWTATQNESEYAADVILPCGVYQAIVCYDDGGLDGDLRPWSWGIWAAIDEEGRTVMRRGGYRPTLAAAKASAAIAARMMGY